MIAKYFPFLNFMELEMKWNEFSRCDLLWQCIHNERSPRRDTKRRKRRREREGVEVKTLQRCWQQLNAVLASVIDIHLMCRAQCALSGNEGSHAPSRWVWQGWREREDYHQPVIFISITWAIFYTREGWEGCSGLWAGGGVEISRGSSL